MNRFWLISSLVFAEALTAPAAHAQTIPGSTGHGAPTFNCAVNDTYKDLDSGLVWRCGPTANTWIPTPQFLPWVTPTSGNCPVGNGNTFVSSACGGIGTNNNFVFVGDSLTGGLHSSTGNATFGTTTPSTGYATQTTASASANSSTVTVANATGIIVGQHISVSPQSAGAFNIGVPAGALVTSVSGTTIGISINTQVAFTNTPINFYSADYPAVAMTLPNFQGHGTATNYGVAGWTIQLNLNAYFTSVHNLAPAVTGKPGFLFVMMGVNDINVSNSSAATIENLLSQ